MSLSEMNMNLVKNDLVQWTTILAVSNLLLKGVPGFNNEWNKFAMSTLLGFVIHGFATNKITSLVNSKIGDDKNANNAVSDVVKFGTVFAVRKVMVDYLANKPFDLTETKFLYESGLTLTGYALFHLVAKDMLVNVGVPVDPLVADLVLFSMGYALAKYVMEGTINTDNLYELGSYLAGFGAYHLGTKNLV